MTAQLRKARPDLKSVLGTYQRSTNQLMNYVEIAKQIHGAYTTTQDLLQRRLGYVVFLDGNDMIHHEVRAFLRNQVPQGKQRLVTATSSVNDGWDEDGEEDGTVPGGHVELDFAGNFDRVATIGGHRMRVAVAKTGNRPTATRAGLYFFARSLAGQQAVVELFRQFAEARVTSPETRTPTLYTMRHGEWQRLFVPFRPSESVILADGQLDRIIADLDGFLRAERFYTRRSIPWHRGYLFHGPPGTGKTSLVKGLAKHCGLDLYTVPLGDVKNDSELTAIVSEIRQRSILLLEDVDVYAAARSRKQSDGKASLSGLLQTLDGAATPHGLITMLTTNHLGTLDSALMRPGRIDCVEELAAPTPSQTRRLFEYFYERSATSDFADLSPSSVAVIVEVFKKHLHDPDAAEQALLRGYSMSSA